MNKSVPPIGVIIPKIGNLKITKYREKENIKLPIIINKDSIKYI